MTALTVHKIPDAVHRALCTRAARHGRSAEAEALAILQDTVQPDLPPAQHGKSHNIVAAFADAARAAGLTNEDVDIIERSVAEGRAEARQRYKAVDFG